MPAFLQFPFENIGYAGIFLFMVIDGLNIPFTPSEVFLGFIGYLARTNQIDPVMGYSLTLLGSLTGNLISFYLGQKIGRPIFERYGKYLLLTPERLQQAEEKIKTLKRVAPFGVRFIPGLRNMGSLILGVFRAPAGAFMLLSTAGLAVYNAAFFLLGYILGERTDSFSRFIPSIVLIIVISGLCLVAITWYRFCKRKRST